MRTAAGYINKMQSADTPLAPDRGHAPDDARGTAVEITATVVHSA